MLSNTFVGIRIPKFIHSENSQILYKFEVSSSSVSLLFPDTTMFLPLRVFLCFFVFSNVSVSMFWWFFLSECFSVFFVLPMFLFPCFSLSECFSVSLYFQSFCFYVSMSLPVRVFLCFSVVPRCRHVSPCQSISLFPCFFSVSLSMFPCLYICCYLMLLCFSLLYYNNIIFSLFL